MSWRLSSERRRAWWRWGWGALIVGVFFCPLGKTGSCYEPADGVEWSGDTCTTAYVPLMGSVFGYSIPAP